MPQRMFGWSIRAEARDGRFSPAGFFDGERSRGDYLHVFDAQGRRVTQRELDFDGWHDWQAELAAQAGITIDFFYGNFVRGARRAVIDGIEPAERPSESIQFELFEYVYHQVLRKECGVGRPRLVSPALPRPCRRDRAARLRATAGRRHAAGHVARADARTADRAAAGRRRRAGHGQYADLHGQAARRRNTVAGTVYRQASRQCAARTRSFATRSTTAGSGWRESHAAWRNRCACSAWARAMASSASGILPARWKVTLMAVKLNGSLGSSSHTFSPWRIASSWRLSRP